MTESTSENTQLEVIQKNQETTQLAGLLVGGGILGGIYLLLKKSRKIVSWIIPIGLIVAGLDILFNDQKARVQMTGDQIIAELDGLDPITKAEVIKYVADHEIKRIKR